MSQFSNIHRPNAERNGQPEKPIVAIYSPANSQVSHTIAAKLAASGAQVDQSIGWQIAYYENSNPKVPFIIEVDPRTKLEVDPRTKLQNENGYRTVFDHILEACQKGHPVCWYVLGGQRSEQFNERLESFRERTRSNTGEGIPKPLEIANDPNLSHAIATHLLPKPRNKRILMVSDSFNDSLSSSLFSTLSRKLTNAGCEVMEYTNHTLAAEHLRQNPDHYDLIITNQRNQHDNDSQAGTNLLKVAREIQPDMPRFLISAFPSGHLNRDLEKAGLADDPLTRAFSTLSSFKDSAVINFILNHIHNTLDRPEISQGNARA